MMSYGHLWHVLTLWSRHFSMMGDTPAMPLFDAHSGGFFVSSIGLDSPCLDEAAENTREGVRA